MEPIFSVLMNVDSIEGTRVELRTTDSTPQGIVESRLWMNYGTEEGMELWPRSKADRSDIQYEVSIHADVPHDVTALPATVTINDVDRAGEGGRLVLHAFIPEDMRQERRGILLLEMMTFFQLDADLSRFSKEAVYWISFDTLEFDGEEALWINASPGKAPRRVSQRAPLPGLLMSLPEGAQ